MFLGRRLYRAKEVGVDVDLPSGFSYRIAVEIETNPMTALSTPQHAIQAPRPRIPDRLRVLYVTTLHRSSNWLVEAFATDSASRVYITEKVGVTSGLAALREEAFDAVVVFHEPGVLDALDFVEGLRTAGHDEPMIVLGLEPPQAFEAFVYEVGADAYCSLKQTTTRSLLWEFARAIRRFEIVRENRRLQEADKQRLASEHAEAERLLTEQRKLLTELESVETGDLGHAQGVAESLASDASVTCIQLPEALVTHYRDLLQTYVVMGSGNLTDEMTKLTEVLIDAEITAQRVMQLHVDVLEKMIDGLGRRSARHVMNRADLLVLEVAVHLAEGYRQRFLERRQSNRQRLLPGFAEADVYSPPRFPCDQIACD